MFFKNQRNLRKIEKMESEIFTLKKAKILKEQNKKEDLFIFIYGKQIKLKHFFIANIVFLLIIIFILL